MTDTNDTKQVFAPQDTNPVTQEPARNFEHTKIKSNFTQSPSTYWALALPLLSARYGAEAINNGIKPVIDWKRAKPIDPAVAKVSKPGLKNTLWAGLVGAGMVGVTAYYTARTYGDMKREFKEVIGWEFNKDPEKVGFFDMLKSKNVLVHDAAKNLASRSAKRFAAHLPFFAFMLHSPFKLSEGKLEFHNPLKENPSPVRLDGTTYARLLSPKQSINLGVGTNAAYLASDALGRKKTFFEELQHMIDTKINHSDTTGQLVLTQDIISLYDRQTRHDGSPMPKMSSQEWQNDVKIFEHMADLMNQTYGNTPKKGFADFTIPKLIYLMGNGLLKSDAPEKSRAYVDVANRYGIPAVKQLDSELKAGKDWNVAMAAFPEAALAMNMPEPEPLLPADTVPIKTFANEELMKARPQAISGSHVERTAKPAEAAAGLSI